MKHKKFLIILGSFFLILGILIWSVFNTSFGSDLIKIYFQKKIDVYFPEMKIEKIVVYFNNFSMILKEDKNLYKVCGEFFPFDAILEGSIKEIDIGNKKFKENANLSGHIVKKNGYYLINSNVYFDNNVGFLNIKLNKTHKIIDFKSMNINLKYILNKLSIPLIKNLNGSVNLRLLKKDFNYTIYTDIKGNYKNNAFNSKIKFYFNSFNKIFSEGMINSNILKGTFKSKIYNKKLIYTASFDKFDLSLLDLIYPFKGIVNLKIKKDESGIIKFFSNDFSGFKDKALNIEFNMPVQTFFNYLGLDNIFEKGNVIGRMVIDKKGIFNFVIQNAILRKKIAQKLHLKNNYFQKIFVKGSFYHNKVIFDLLTNNKNYFISIKNGYILIDKNIYSCIIKINDSKYEIYYKLFNKNLKLIKKKNLKNKDNQILVF